jgi:hypothetical protein
MSETESAVDPVAQEIHQEAERLSWAFADPEAFARRLRDFLAKRFPEQAPAYWITAAGDRDKGIAFTIRRRAAWSLDALAGEKTAGLAVARDLGTVNGVAIAIGVGVVSPLDHPADAEVVLAAKLGWGKS